MIFNPKSITFAKKNKTDKQQTKNTKQWDIYTKSIITIIIL
ncbi:hypothetical protein CCAN12_660012 [Capnocytophaga canimorsus]|uniref:Uncharacterized protein n=1 Tax=Capnocytophaga canimorsus TaxID=28188 RepID=A0A0B7HEJ9_9FLAO|nr:hypothetical protein CCAN12_660012 [Capnocytophaga canimorsus]